MAIGSPDAEATREFCVLVRRAAKRGELDVGALIDSYMALAPAGHPHLDEPRKIALATLVDAIQSLPRGFLDHQDVRLVPDLSRYDLRRIPSQGPAAGVLEDGTLLIEARNGMSSLLSFSATVCALAVEWSKIRTLLAHWSDPEETPEEDPEASLHENYDDDHAPNPNEAVEDDTEHGSAPAIPASVGDEAAAIFDDEIADFASPVEIGTLAFELGIDERDFLDASSKTHGTFHELIERELRLPSLRMHADLSPRIAAKRGSARARYVHDQLVEAGFGERPVHLWIGDSVVTDCLSPYPRDLREPLLHWASTGPEQLGNDLRVDDDLVDEATLYALMRDFLTVDALLHDERAAAEGSVGIERCGRGSGALEMIDLDRIDPTAIDARLVEWHSASGAVLLRIPRPVDDGAEEQIRAMLDAFGSQLESITLTLEGSFIQHHGVDTVLLPRLLLGWEGEEKITSPLPGALRAEEFMGLASTSPQTVLSVPTASLLNARHIEALSAAYGVGAIEKGGAGILGAIRDAAWRGALLPTCSVSWTLTAAGRRVGTRTDLATLRSLSGIAIALLRWIGGNATDSLDPQPPEPEKERAKVPSHHAFRIRA